MNAVLNKAKRAPECAVQSLDVVVQNTADRLS